MYKNIYTLLANILAPEISGPLANRADALAISAFAISPVIKVYFNALLSADKLLHTSEMRVPALVSSERVEYGVGPA